MSIVSTYNATLYYQIPQNIEIDPNCPFIEPEIEYVEYVVRLSIEEEKGEYDTATAGIEKGTILATGRLVSPVRFQPWMRQQRDVEVEFSNTSTTKYKGKALIKPTIASRLGLESFFGDYIRVEIDIDI